MIGRHVKEGTRGLEGIISRWEPLGAGMNDVLLERSDGSLIWVSSHTLRPTDGLGPLASRHEARHAADLEAQRSLAAIRAKFVAEDWHRPWPGAEFGKAIIGRAMVGAEREVAERLANYERAR